MSNVQESKDKNTIDNGKKELYFALKQEDYQSILNTLLELPLKYGQVLRPVIQRLQSARKVELESEDAK